MSDYTAKDIRVAPIRAADANALVKRVHYSGKVVNNSQVHLGVYLGDRLEGAMQFGPSLDKRKIQGLVRDTLWNNFIELNRMAFSDRLPRNSESRALGVAFRLLRRAYPHLEWVVSFADATQCGDGTIYRASGFVLTAITPSKEMIRLPSGEVTHRIALNTSKGKRYGGSGKYGQKEWIRRTGGEALCGNMLRYIYFLNPAARERLTVPVIPFSRIEEMGAGMYKGQTLSRTKDQAPEFPSGLGGETPTCALHLPPARASAHG